jgi:hypothetical protein
MPESSLAVTWTCTVPETGWPTAGLAMPTAGGEGSGSEQAVSKSSVSRARRCECDIRPFLG